MSNTTPLRPHRFVIWAWTAIMLLIGGFQLYRGALADGIVFLVLGAGLVADTLGWLPATRGKEWKPSRILLPIALAIAAGVLALTPRHGLADGIALIVAGILVLLVVWPSGALETDEVPPMTKRIVRTAALWAGVGVAACLWELAMYFLGTYAPGGRTDHPALSDLLNPLLENPAGRILFVAAWLLGGIALTRRGRRR